MFILGLTGSAAMGKSTAAAIFHSLKIPVFDADASVHRLQARGGAAVAAIEAAFPGVVQAAAVDRAALGARAFENPQVLRRLEGILHPLVRGEQDRFLRHASRQRHRLVVLDIPLLFETQAERECDAVAVVSAPRFVQLRRLLDRPGMTVKRAEAVLALQMSDVDKRKRSDFIIPSGLGRSVTARTIRRIVDACSNRAPGHWPPRARRRRVDHCSART